MLEGVLNSVKAATWFIVGWALMTVGGLISLTLFGAIIGVPLMIAGMAILYQEMKKYGQEILAEGIAAGLRKAREEEAGIAKAQVVEAAKVATNTKAGNEARAAEAKPA